MFRQLNRCLVTLHSPATPRVRRQRSPHSRNSSAGALLVSQLVLSSLLGAMALQAASAPVSDDFNGTSLNTALWTAATPAGGTVSVSNGHLMLAVPGGSNHDAFVGGDNAVRIAQSIANADFDVTAKFDSAPVSAYQGEGILVSQDSGTYLRFEVYSDGSRLYALAATVSGGNQTTNLSSTLSGVSAPFWVRVQRSGNTWTLNLSTNGSTYSKVGSFSETVTVAQVGPYAWNYSSPASSAAALNSSVDYFYNLASSSPVPDLTLSKTHTGTFAQGGSGSYTLTVRNAGAAATSGQVTVTDSVPTGLTASTASGSGWSCTVSSQTVSCSRSDALAASSSYPAITLAVAIASNASSSLTNTASVSGGGETNTANDSASDPTSITGSTGGVPDLTLSKTHTGTFTQGGSGSYTLTVRNAGTAATSGQVTVTDAVPTGLTPSTASGSGWGCTVSSQTVSCSRSDALAANSSYPAITLAVAIASNASTSLTNTASVSGGGETNTANDSASDATTISTGGGGGGGAPVSDDFNGTSLNTALWTAATPAGGTVSVSNGHLMLAVPGGSNHDAFSGGDNAVRIAQSIANADFDVAAKFDSAPASAYQGEGILVSQDSGTYLRFEVYSDGSRLYALAATVSGGNQTTNLSSTLSGVSAPFWVRVQRSGNTWTLNLSTNGSTYSKVGSFSETVTVAQVGPYAWNYSSTPSSAAALNSSVDYFYNLASSSPVPDLTLSKSHTGTFAQGGSGSYTLTVRNAGAAATSGQVTVSDTVPTGLTPSTASGSGWSCTVSSQTVSCSRSDALAASSSYPAITLAVAIASNASSSLTNTASVSGGGETNTANDSASDPTSITGSTGGVPDLTLSKSHTGTFTQGGSGSYTLTVRNAGTAATSGQVTVTDAVPVGLTPSTASGSGWGCTVSSQTVSCSRSDSLAASSSYPAITLAVSIASDASSSVTNTASVSGGGESNTSNDSASDGTTISTGGAGPVSDDFNAKTLNTALWTFVNPLNDGSVSLDGSEALLSVPAGVAHNPWTEGDQAVSIMQPIGNVDFAVEVKFNTLVQTGLQDEGIIVAQDANNYLRFDVYDTGSGVNYFVAGFLNDNPTVEANNQIGISGSTIWLRVTRTGSTWTGSWSSDGVTFTQAANFSFGITASSIGPYVGNNGSPVPAYTAKVDYFHNLAGTSVPDLTLAKTHSGNFVQSGTGSYSLVATNSGSAATSGQVTVTDSVPAGLTPSGATGSGWNCTVSGQTASCSRSDAVGSGASYPAITLAVTIASNASTSVTNTASISGGGETNTANDSASDPTTITGSAAGVPDLTLAKTHTGTFAQGGSGSYTLTVRNAGTAATSGQVTMTDPVPAGLTPSTATGSGWSCTVSSQTVTCSRSDALAANGSYPAITLAVAIASNASTSLTNTASVSGGGETNTSNDSASDATGISAGGAGAPVSDDFHAASLNTKLWSFENPVGDGSVALNGTHALISVPAGTSHNLWTDGNNSARIVQPVANGNFDVVVKFDSTVDQLCQIQGLLVEQDAGNYIRFDVYSNGPNAMLFAASFANNSPTVFFNNAIASQLLLPFYLRVTRVGNTFTLLTSSDGQSYTQAASFTQQITVNRVGPFAGNNACGYTAPAFTSNVDYFFNTASPIVPQDGLANSNPIFNIWYGDNQTFGQNGIPQTWVNVLGTVLSPYGPVQSLQYTLNGGALQSLDVGPTTSRLVQPGDFDIDIPYASLNSGANAVAITATDALGNKTTHTVTVNYAAGNTWPLPYSITWTPTTNLQSVLQVIDGKWQVQADGSGVRSTEVGYDRLLTLGDMSAWKNYQVTAEVTLHYIWDPNFAGPPGHDSDFGVGIVMGWKGHTTDVFGQPDSAQPGFGHPFPGLGWYTSAGGYGNVLQLYENTSDHRETVMTYDTSGFQLQFETKYIFKVAVHQNAGQSTSHFSFKVWASGTAEPSAWTLESDGQLSQGSIVLAAHRSDVTFGQITATALP